MPSRLRSRIRVPCRNSSALPARNLPVEAHPGLASRAGFLRIAYDVLRRFTTSPASINFPKDHIPLGQVDPSGSGLTNLDNVNDVNICQLKIAMRQDGKHPQISTDIHSNRNPKANIFRHLISPAPCADTLSIRG